MRSQRSSCERTLLDLSLKSGDCLLYKEVYFRTASAGFFSNSAAIFAFLERDWTLLSCFDGKTADILMLVLMLMHDRFTHATQQHNHKHKHKKMENFPFPYAYAYVYVAPVHTYNSYAYVYVYAYAYAYAYVAV